MDDQVDENCAATVLRRARRRAELSQRALAARAGVDLSVLSAYESGTRQPSARMLSRLVRAAGADLSLADPQQELRRQARILELVVDTAWAMPHRARTELSFPSLMRR